MSATRVIPALLVAVLVSPLSAQEGKAKKKPDPKVLRLHLMEGSVVSARLAVESITVATDFGSLEIPVDKIVSFTPGLESHPEQYQRIRDLIAQLGDKSAKPRDEAEKELSGMGLAVKAMLDASRDDTDPERRTRIGRLLEQIEQLQEELDEEGGPMPTIWIPEDTVQTPKFTVVGKISPQAFKMQTKFGVLTVSINDIHKVEREVEQSPDLRRTITVAGQNLVVVNYKKTRIRLKRGDRVTISASGTVNLPPWGSRARSGPDGAANYGQYKSGMPVGALVARVGTSGKEFKVGSSHKFTATSAGELYFAVAMHTSYLRNYSFTGEYKVKVRVTPAAGSSGGGAAKPGGGEAPEAPDPPATAPPQPGR